MKRFPILVLLILVASISACEPGQMLGPTFTATPTSTQIPTITPKPTNTLTPTVKPTETITPTPTLPFASAATSPDGKLIAGVITSGNVSPGLYVMNIGGIGWTPVFDQAVNDFAWSPDSKRLAFIMLGGTFERTIAVVNSDGSNLTKLGTKGDSTGFVSSGGQNFAVSISVIKFEWSADGTKIYFSATYGNTGKVYIYSTDSTRYTDPVRLNFTDLP
jgi:Tol biopolymer transport system component